MSIAYNFDKFGFLTPTDEALPTAFGSLDKNFRSIQTKASFAVSVTREFISASAGATTFLLPSGSQTTTDYLIVKTDSSANAVTITPKSPDLINGAATIVLNKQYQFVWLTFYNGIWYTTSSGGGSVNFGSVGPSLVITNGNLDSIQDIRTTSSPTFAGLTSPIGVMVPSTGAFTNLTVTGTISDVANVGYLLNANGVFYVDRVHNGTAANPSIYFAVNSDNGLGFYRSAVNVLSVAVNGVLVGGWNTSGFSTTGTITTLGGATFHTTSTSLTNGGAASSPTLGSAGPTGATTPTKWVGINDNGTTRYIPAW